MDLSNLPAAVVENNAPDPVNGALVVAPSSAQPAPLPSLSESDIGQKVANAIAKLGVDPQTIQDTLRSHLVAKLEAAANAYETTQIEADKPFLHNEGLRLLAALHAL